MFAMSRSIKTCCWNVRGLGDAIKCGDVLSELLSSNSDLVFLQETKLADITALKLLSFLPRRLNKSVFTNANGASGGILSAWSDSSFTCVDSNFTANTLSVHLFSTSSDLSIFVTNVYAPATPELRMDFLTEIRGIIPPHNTPWMLCGDFNMIRYSHEKNNSSFRVHEADAFNDYINDLCLIEIPLLDRSFTWSNKCSTPTLERLDRVFINLTWDEKLPNTILSSLTRTTSDHVPLMIEIATSIPKSRLFRFDNFWVSEAGFYDSVNTSWSCRTGNSDPSTVLAAKLSDPFWTKSMEEIQTQPLPARDRLQDCHQVDGPH